MCAAFPRPDYYGGSAPSPGHQQTACLPATGLAGRARGQPRDGSHVHHEPVDEHGAQLFPGSPATSTPQAFPMTTGPASTSAAPESSNPFQGLPRAHPGPHPPGSSRFLSYGGSTTGSHELHLLIALTGPGPSGSAGPPRLCQGCSHPPRHLPDQAALSFTSLLRQAGGGPFHPARSNGASWRTKTYRKSAQHSAITRVLSRLMLYISASLDG
jgi:hypothetical protein